MHPTAPDSKPNGIAIYIYIVNKYIYRERENPYFLQYIYIEREREPLFFCNIYIGLLLYPRNLRVLDPRSLIEGPKYLEHR